ncbi:AMP-binding protein [Govanella unica]|uniref:AMP-binding protein n=1 Tax=Govanella unica TaxID=2975056 RepID=A0A9X3TXD8_9PROT|nr:AMP-binding protein [Govania unica]MDA5193511.1 AMP-binding protein [Govania unica]
MTKSVAPNGWQTAPFRPVRFPDVGLHIEQRADGTQILSAKMPLGDFEPGVIRSFFAHAAAEPDRIWIARRTGPGGAWQTLTFGAARDRIRAVAAWLGASNLPPGRPVLILSGNGFAHALMLFGAMAAGVPVCSVSPNYALLGGGSEGGNYARLRYVVDLVKPAVLFAEEGGAYAAAIAAVRAPDMHVVSAAPAAYDGGAEDFSVISTAAVPPDVSPVYDPDAPARYMLTSGSSGRPKAVIHTERMIAANINQTHRVMGDGFGWERSILDWLPWHHASGSTTLMATAYLGSTLYMDDGKPTPEHFAQSIANLRDIPVRYYATMPAGFAMLADALEADAALRQTFYSELRTLMFGGAGLPQPLYDRIQKMAVETIGQRIIFVSGFGSTESTSGCMMTWFPSDRVGIGLPLPGTVLKLVPDPARDGIYDIRLKGPMITPGYLDDPARNAEAFDDEGFYCMGDLGRFHDSARPELGLAFAGRRSDQFKLGNGTFVAGGHLRAELMKRLDPHVLDLVICGDGHDYLALMIWLRGAGCAEEITRRLADYNRDNPGQSTVIRRFLLLTEPPSAAGHEISDKGSINRAVVMERRVADLARLYAAVPDGAVVSVK